MLTTPGYPLLSGLGALNSKYHVRTLGALERCIVQFGVLQLRMKNNKLIILMFHRVLNTIEIFQKISYTLWNVCLTLSHPPSLLGQCPKFEPMENLGTLQQPFLEEQ